MAENISTNLTVETLASRAGMSVRNFSRAYRAASGTTPAKAVEAMRVDTTKRLLEDSAMPMKAVSLRAGFGDDERMRRAFQRTVGVSPQEYRARFGLKIDVESASLDRRPRKHVMRFAHLDRQNQKERSDREC
jgi:transcriptional regulator GlxA family with amidase domain